MIFFFKPWSLRQFKYFCLSIEKMSEENWMETESCIMNSSFLKSFFKINGTEK